MSVKSTTKQVNKKRVILTAVLLALAAVLLTIFLLFFVKIQGEKQAVVDYCRSRLGTIILQDAVSYKGYSKEYDMDRFVVSYNAADYFLEEFDKDDMPPQAEGVFYVQKDEGSSKYRVFSEEDLTTDPFGDRYVENFMIAGDASALAFADQLIMNADDSFSCEAYPYTDVYFYSTKQYYTVSRTDDAQRGYAVELWLNESGKLSVKNARLHQQPISMAFVTDDEEAAKLADIVICSAYEDAPYIYPDLNAYTEDNKEWTVMRNDGGWDTDGAGVSVRVCSDGTLYDLCYGGE